MVYNFMITEYLRRSVKVEAQSECDRDIESMSVFTDGRTDTHDASYEADSDFSKYREYLEYTEQWQKEHNGNAYAGMAPVCYEEWLNNEGEEE